MGEENVNHDIRKGSGFRNIALTDESIPLKHPSLRCQSCRNRTLFSWAIM